MATHTHTRSRSIWDPQIVRTAIWDSFRKLHPRTMARNPVMFVVEVGMRADHLAPRPGRDHGIGQHRIRAADHRSGSG